MQASQTKPVSGVKEFIKVLKEIAQKLKMSEMHVVGEFRENPFIEGAYNFTIKGLYEMGTHRELPFPDEFNRLCYCLTRDEPSADLYLEQTESYWKCYCFKSSPLMFKPDEEAMKSIKPCTFSGKYGYYNSYIWDTTVDDAELAKIGDIQF